jgi:hypothetical protein
LKNEFFPLRSMNGERAHNADSNSDDEAEAAVCSESHRNASGARGSADGRHPVQSPFYQQQLGHDRHAGGNQMPRLNKIVGGTSSGTQQQQQHGGAFGYPPSSPGPIRSRGTSGLGLVQPASPASPDGKDDMVEPGSGEETRMTHYCAPSSSRSFINLEAIGPGDSLWSFSASPTFKSQLCVDVGSFHLTVFHDPRLLKTYRMYGI